MKLRVAIPLLAISLVSPAITSSEQAQRGRGYKPRESGGGSTATAKSGGDNRGGSDRPATSSTNRPAERRAESRPESSTEERRAVSRPEETRAEEPRAESRPQERRADNRDDDRDDDRGRYAVPKSNPSYNPAYNGSNNNYYGARYNGNGYGPRGYPNINVNIGSSHHGHYAPVHYDYWARRYYRWSPIGYAPWSLIYGSIGFTNFGYYGGVGPNPFYFGYNGYGWGYGPGAYAYPPYQVSGYDPGGIRLDVRPRDAQVFVDGYYAGIVDEFDGLFQSLRLDGGGHKIEIRMPGFEDFALDVHVQPGRKFTIRADLRPKP